MCPWPLEGVSLAEFLLSLQMSPGILICGLGALQEFLGLFHSSGNTDKATVVRGLRAGTCKEISLGWKEPEHKINEKKIREVNVSLGEWLWLGQWWEAQPLSLLSHCSAQFRCMSCPEHKALQAPWQLSQLLPKFPARGICLSCKQTSCLPLPKHFHRVKLLQIQFAPPSLYQ